MLDTIVLVWWLVVTGPNGSPTTIPAPYMERQYCEEAMNLINHQTASPDYRAACIPQPFKDVEQFRRGYNERGLTYHLVPEPLKENEE